MGSNIENKIRRSPLSFGQFDPVGNFKCHLPETAFFFNKLHHVSNEGIFDTDYNDSNYIFVEAIGCKRC